MLNQKILPILIFDRDGTLIVDTGYIKNAKDVKLIPSMPELIATLRKLPLRIGVVSNQSGVGRGYISFEEAKAVHDAFVLEYLKYEVFFDFIEYCFHDPSDRCACRKPETGLVRNSKNDFVRESKRIFMVGDKESDRDFAMRLEAEFFLIDPRQSGHSFKNLELEILRWWSNG
jgi:histidinol-phosphate phosphatase family protein